MRRVDIFKRNSAVSSLRRNPRIAHETINDLPSILNRREKPVHGLLRSNVNAVGKDVRGRMTGSQFLLSLMKMLSVVTEEGDPETCIQERCDGRKPDPRASARHDGNWCSGPAVHAASSIAAKSDNGG
nr:hypothetical protein SHINE37_60061 [Rhizobiaceae bacterium]